MQARHPVHAGARRQSRQLERTGRQWTVWQRTGDTYETLTLSPSIRRIQRYSSREEARSDNVMPEYFTESLTCTLHIFIRDRRIVFCGDSR